MSSASPPDPAAQTSAGAARLMPARSVPERISILGAFLLPALALWLPSGYAWGTALLLVGAALTMPQWWRLPVQPRSARWLALVIALMALAWVHGSNELKGLSALNKPVRYLMALPCLFFLLRFPPRREWLLAGIAVGAGLGGLRALTDVYLLGLERPWTQTSHTANAIQLGNLCGLFGLMCWIQLVVYWRRWSPAVKVAVAVCCLLGLLGSVLSQTRGGWLALALTWIVVAWLLARRLASRRVLAGVVMLMCALVVVGWEQAGKIGERLSWAYDETMAYRLDRQAANSVGQRLDHWQLAWRMGWQKPLAGWGEVGYQQEKARRVAAGRAQPAVLLYGHAHNELLDQFVKRGLIGVGSLLALYLVPLAVFWPRRRRRDAPGARLPENDEDETCLRLIGCAIPVSFAGFGLTQVFFAHYNGVVLYVFLVLLVYACVRGLQSAPAAEAAAQTPPRRAMSG